jgi:ribosomal protein S27AE
MKVIRIVGAINGQPMASDGAYLKDFDFEAREGRGTLIATEDIGAAMRFDNFAEAADYWKRQSVTVPVRPHDGKPNRPFTAYSVLIDNVAPSITCPVCGSTSYNPNDIEQRYCGNCHAFTGFQEESRP